MMQTHSLDQHAKAGLTGAAPAVPGCPPDRLRDLQGDVLCWLYELDIIETPTSADPLSADQLWALFDFAEVRCDEMLEAKARVAPQMKGRVMEEYSCTRTSLNKLRRVMERSI
jgi:hypothetical protein